MKPRSSLRRGARTSRQLVAMLLPGLVSVLLLQSGWAASQRPLSLEELVETANEVVVGRVMHSEARWHGRLIVTVSTVEVEEPIKGQPGAQIDITQLGGTAIHPRLGKPVTMTASGYAALRPGENVLLFVHKTRDDRRQLVGGAQGKFVIREEVATRGRVLPVGPKQLKVTREDDRHTVATEAMTLEAMLRRIRAYMQQPDQRSGEKTP